MPGYAELHAISNFTFQRGASHPHELVERAAALGYRALALTDECSLAGIVRAHMAAKEHGIQLLVGAEFFLEDGLHLVVLARSRRGYGQLSALITRARRAAPKGSYRLAREALPGQLDDCLLLWCPPRAIDEAPPEPAADGRWLATQFPGRVYLAVELLAGGADRRRLQRLLGLARDCDLPPVACGDVHMHRRSRRALQDTLTAIRLHTTVAEAGLDLYANGERHLRPPATLAKLYPQALLDATLAVAERCEFSLDELRYEYPEEIVPRGLTPAQHLYNLCEEGIRRRWPEGVSQRVRGMIEHELRLIAELRYEPFFLTVYDVVRFARSQGILCQGRGSAANSTVCFCLGITEVDPARMAVLFERFISKERNEPPDIDVDFEHERREEVIQYIYRKYGRERAALAATVISYRPRSAMRDIGKALGFDALQVDRLARSMHWFDGRQVADERVHEAGFDPANPRVRQLLTLVHEVQGFPRHLSQHVGGFVISRGPLAELVPVENAAMDKRTIIQWDKDDLEDLRLLKVDVLGLGMLTAIRRAFSLIEKFDGRKLTLAGIPAGDSDVYEMISRGDTLGVFQIESRAQMAMLPRMRPRCFYDLVIEVAIVRPGPIQGDMVHPYLRRRNGEEPVQYPSEAVRGVLERTLGVPIFQEQVMHLAMAAAGFTAGEADQLRRSMAAWKRRGGLDHFEEKLVQGMLARGYDEDFAQRVFSQIKGFGEYGFPESHAASFALLVYVSAWLKHHTPAAFFAALINSQPMGFYAPSQLVQAAQRAQVSVVGVDITVSDWDCTLEHDTTGNPALRLGLRMIKGLKAEAGERILVSRAHGQFADVTDLTARAQLDRHDLEALAAGAALTPLAGHRYRARWSVTGIEKGLPLFPELRIAEGTPLLRTPTAGEQVTEDYQSLGLSLAHHPLQLLRERFASQGMQTAAELASLPDGARVTTAGLVITRQRPGTASGVTFVTLEDETGCSNLVVWKKVADEQREALLKSRLMVVRGKLQRESNVIHVVANQMFNYNELLGELTPRSRDFH